jgi:hypothetical protein
VWCVLLGNNLLGQHVLEGLSTAPYFRIALEHELSLHLKDVPLATQRRMWLQPDGAPRHFGRAVTEFLSEDCEGIWIGTGGPVAWHARSPDLHPVDFFL